MNIPSVKRTTLALIVAVGVALFSPAIAQDNHDKKLVDSGSTSSLEEYIGTYGESDGQRYVITKGEVANPATFPGRGFEDLDSPGQNDVGATSDFDDVRTAGCEGHSGQKYIVAPKTQQ